MLNPAAITSTRESKGMTQKDAAASAGMKSQQWNDIESGRKVNISMDTLGKIAKALGVDAADLLVKGKKTAKGK